MVDRSGGTDREMFVDALVYLTGQIAKYSNQMRQAVAANNGFTKVGETLQKINDGVAHKLHQTYPDRGEEVDSLLSHLNIGYDVLNKKYVVEIYDGDCCSHDD